MNSSEMMNNELIAMTLRQEIGIACGLTGILINLGHFLLFFVSGQAEKYHGHELVIGFGIVLVLFGVILLTDKKQKP